MAIRRKQSSNAMIGYVRASTDLQKYTLESQEKRIRQDCNDEGFQLLSSVGDNGVVVEVECSTKERELLNDVQARCERGEAKGIICTNIDRVGRSQFHLASIIKWAEECKIDLYSTEAGWHIKDGEMVDTMLPFRVAMAQVELGNIRARTKRGLEVAKAKGVVLGAKVENEDLSKRIWEMREAGMPWRDIVNVLDAEGVRTAKGCKVLTASAFHMHERYGRTVDAGRAVGG